MELWYNYNESKKEHTPIDSITHQIQIDKEINHETKGSKKTSLEEKNHCPPGQP
jgi:hypothetical protein